MEIKVQNANTTHKYTLYIFLADNFVQKSKRKQTDTAD